MTARVKPDLGEGAIEALKRSNPMALENLVADVVAELINSCQLDLSPSQASELRDALESHMQLTIFHSGRPGDPLRARLWWKSDSVFPIGEMLMFGMTCKDIATKVDVVTCDIRFVIELLPASKFILDNWKDPDDPDRQPVAATKQEALAKAAAMRDHARYLERLANGKTLEDGAMDLLVTARGHVITGPYEKVLSNIDDAIKALTDENAH